jgi:hypothetical protein
MYITGSTGVTTENAKYAPHHPGQLAKEEGYLEGREVWATVRDPESFYPSLWLLASLQHMRPSLQVWGQGSCEFHDVLYGWTHPREVGTPEGPYSAALFAPLMPDWFEAMQKHDFGMCSFLHAYILSPWDVLRERGIDVASWYPDRYFYPSDLKTLHKHGPVNTAKQRDPNAQRPEVTDEHREWIRRADGNLADQMRAHTS